MADPFKHTPLADDPELEKELEDMLGAADLDTNRLCQKIDELTAIVTKSVGLMIRIRKRQRKQEERLQRIEEEMRRR